MQAKIVSEDLDKADPAESQVAEHASQLDPKNPLHQLALGIEKLSAEDAHALLKEVVEKVRYRLVTGSRSSRTCLVRPQFITRRRQTTPIPTRFVTMEMPKLKLKVEDRLAKEFLKASEQMWPGQGQRATNRLARDAITRYLRYCADGNRNRS